MKPKKMSTLRFRNSLNRSLWRRGIFLPTLALACFGLSPAVRAISPPPGGGYVGWNTAAGQDALLNLTTGTFNTAIGGHALYGGATGESNTAVGAFCLAANGPGDQNVAIGQGALGNNHGSGNVAAGFAALANNTSGNSSQAFGFVALFHQEDGVFNDGFGRNTLYSNVHGDNNTAMGDEAGFQITGNGNIDIGAGAKGLTGENGVTRIGEDGVSGFTACFIKGIYGSFENGRAVYVGSNGHLGTLMSSRRYKEDIKPMAESSETLFALKPVTFRYKKELNPSDGLSFGLIAEDVAQVSAELVTRDKEGKPQTVRYEAVNAMLLNEFLKEHRKVEQLEATVAQQHKGMEALADQLKEQAAQIEKVSAQLTAATPSRGGLGPEQTYAANNEQ